MEAKLVESCRTLYEKNVLSLDEYNMCRKNIESPELNDMSEDKDNFERELLNDGNRADKNHRLNEFSDYLLLLKNNFSNLSIEKKKELTSLTETINRKLKKYLVGTFKNSEDLNYDTFLNTFYETNNSKKQHSEIKTNNITLQQKLNILNDKVDKLSLKNGIIIIVINVVLLILLLRFFYF